MKGGLQGKFILLTKTRLTHKKEGNKPQTREGAGPRRAITQEKNQEVNSRGRQGLQREQKTKRS